MIFSLLLHKVINYTLPSDSRSFVKDILPIISASSIIIIFLADRVISYYVRKAEAKRSWYFKAHLESGIEKITLFFESLEKIIHPAIKKVVSDLTNGLDPTPDIINTLKTSTDLKRRFSHEVLSSIQYAYPVLFSESEKILNDIEDAASNALTNKGSFDERNDKFIEDIFQSKAELILVLSQPVLGFMKKITKEKLKKSFAENFPWKR
jgi:hypothetical protein